MKYATSAAATLALVSSASAHLFLSSPKPIQGNAIKNPLDPSGSDFPCHGVTPPGSGGVDMAVGSKQNLIFDQGSSHDNTAVHGGGSCQVSITYETDMTKLKDPNSWRVLYSIEGGCPTNSKGNLDASYQGPSGSYTGAWQCSDPTTNNYDCINAFQFTIPDGVKTGQATLAWTWFNTIGNREMYMNCAAVNIQNGAKDDSALQSFPPLFVANLASVGGGTCRTTEMTNVGFPNPGANSQQKLAAPNMKVASVTDYPIKTATGCGSSGNYPSAAPSSPAAASPPAAAPSSSSSAVVPSAPPAGPSTTLGTSAAPAPAPTPNTSSIKKRPLATPTTTTKKAKKPAPTNKPAAVAGTGSGAVSLPMPSATGGAGSGSCGAGSVSCIGVNSVVCVDDNHFGICDYNGCAISQAVAPGTMCSQGAITWAKSKSKAKRHQQHLARHLHGAQHFS